MYKKNRALTIFLTCLPLKKKNRNNINVYKIIKQIFLYAGSL